MSNGKTIGGIIMIIFGSILTILGLLSRRFQRIALKKIHFFLYLFTHQFLVTYHISREKEEYRKQEERTWLKMARRKIVAGNWKMNMTPSEAVKLVAELKDLVKSDDVDVVYCVPA